MFGENGQNAPSAGYESQLPENILNHLEFLGGIVAGNTAAELSLEVITNRLNESGEREDELQAEITRLGYEATHDLLTGVYNRRGFFAAATGMIEQMESVIVSLIDLNEFKDLNDNYGHAAGDAALKSVAQGLLVSSDGIVGRFGGDEFVVMEKTDSQKTIKVAAEVAAAAMRASVEAAIAGNEELAHLTAPVTFSIGQSIGSYGVGPSDIDTLIRDADSKMYHEKHNIRERFKH